MLRIDPQSVSELVRASAILLIRLLQVTPGPWGHDDRSDVRQVELRVQVEEALKGEVKPRETVFTVEQRRADVVMDYLGLWSSVPLEKGQRLLAFSGGSSHDPAELLREGTCEQLMVPDGALEDTRAAIALEARDPPFPEVIAAAGKTMANGGPIFARWLWDRATPEALRSASAFDSVATLIEDPRVREPAREALATAAYKTILASGPAPQRMRLVRALLRVLALPSATSLHPNAETVLLRNLLHLDRGEGTPAARAVFAGHEEERKAALATVRARPASPARDRLLGWLERREP